jgi:MFS family permease
MKKIFYGWGIVLATGLICMIGYGTWLYCFGVFFKPMSAEFGWTRAETSFAYFFRSIQGGIASPLVGWAVDKYGSRGVIVVGAIVSGASFALMYLIGSLLGFYLIYGVLLSIGMSAMLYLPAWAVIARWFKRRRSTALALLAVGAGFGGLVCAPAAAFLIERFGWRAAFVVLGVVTWIVVIPLAFVVKNSPAQMGLAPDGDPLPEPNRRADGSTSEADGGEAGASTEEEYTLKQALKSSAFWLLALAFFFFGMAHSTVTVHTVPALTDAGIPETTAAFSFGLLTLVSVIGRLSFGYLGDHMSKRYLFMIAYALTGLGLLVLMNATTMSAVYLFIFLFGVGFGATVPLMPAILADYFGVMAFGKIQGFMNPLMMSASAVGPVFAGSVFDATGSYRIAFLVTGLLSFGSVIAVFFARKARAQPELGAQAV